MKWREKTPFQKGVTVAAWVFLAVALLFLILDIANTVDMVNIADVGYAYPIPLGLAFLCIAILNWQTRKSNAIIEAVCGGIYLLIGIYYLFL